MIVKEKKSLRKKVWLSWSSGKDSAWSLYTLKKDPTINITGIFTTINQKRDRVAIHSTRHCLLQAQAKQLALPLYTIDIPEPCDNNTYEAAMDKLVQKAAQLNITHMAFGDLFLEDIRQYRLKNLKRTPIDALFPLWKLPTKQLAETMLENGVKAIITCVDTKKLPADFVGREFNLELLKDLPKDVDPCGENGEFHTFVYAGPMFKQAIRCQRGRLHRSEQFQFIDLY